MDEINMIKAEKGSKFQIKTYVNDYPSELNNAINLGEIEWISPLRDNKYKELFDISFYIEIKNAFSSFDIDKMNNYWPNRGPHWDAIGIYNDNNQKTLLLIEAKSHKGEMISPIKATDIQSINTITSALASCFNILVGNELHSMYFPVWISKYYQTANRVTFLSKLNEMNIKTTLCFIYFLNDKTHDKKYKLFTTDDNCEVSFKGMFKEMGLCSIERENIKFISLPAKENNL